MTKVWTLESFLTHLNKVTKKFFENMHTTKKVKTIWYVCMCVAILFLENNPKNVNKQSK